MSFLVDLFAKIKNKMQSEKMPPVRKVKQVIVIIKKFPDGKGGFFSLRRGKEISQASHSSMAFLLEKFKNEKEISLNDIEKKWVEEGQTKIVVCVDSLEEYNVIYEKATVAGLIVYRILDNGKTEFKEPTFIALAIGPNFSDEIDKITGSLKLY